MLMKLSSVACVLHQIAFGEVQASSTGVLERLGGRPEKLPALVLICNGDMQLKEVYQVL